MYRIVSACLTIAAFIYPMHCHFVAADEQQAAEKHLRVAVVQFDTKPGLVKENLACMVRLARQAVDNQAQLVMFHELATVDYMDNMRDFAETIPNGPSCQKMGELARELGCYVSFGMPEQHGDKLYIAQVFFSPQKYLYHYRKTWLCQIEDDEGYRNEWARYNPGSGPELFFIGKIRATCLICADAESPRCIEQARTLQPELVFFPINRGARTFHGYPERVARISSVTLIANRVGKSHSRNCGGGSVIYNSNGSIINQANRNFQEEILYSDLVFQR